MVEKLEVREWKNFHDFRELLKRGEVYQNLWDRLYEGIGGQERIH